MDYLKLKNDIIHSIASLVEHIKEEEYWDEVISFCLFTDESLMSMSLLFNTTSHLNKVKDNNYPLTYKYSPSEWFSETICSDVDLFIYNNNAFSDVSADLLANSAKTDFDFHRKKVIACCLEAMKSCIEKNIFNKSDGLIYLFMMSDCYEGDEILSWNNDLNIGIVQKELKQWVEKEL
ncbi:DUF4303 domain-containing protein [Entomohabitans teleogrylli]|uniref:DUF4303 domain-containing protein n=1 Tax=Entomohabitans teleogrylli TaxID=1384589 RepID=UPI00073D6DBD|nr:DUF4303 domain-containing protein [Entomohabitans teleogrylli]